VDVITGTEAREKKGSQEPGRVRKSKALLLEKETSQITRQLSSLALRKRYQLKPLPHFTFTPVQQRVHVTGTRN